MSKNTPSVPTFWRTLAEHRDPEAFSAAHLGEWLADDPQADANCLGQADGIDRRRALTLITAAVAAGAAGCERPRNVIVPYVQMPESVLPGQPLSFATALDRSGYAAAICVESHDGRPTKIEGNPDHPASRGATDAFSQYEILSLYDPERSRTVLHKGEIANLADLLGELAVRRAAWQRNGGDGLRILTGTVTSPFLADLIANVQRDFPRAQWHRWQSINCDHTRAGAELAFGHRLEPLLHLDRARTIVALDDDLLGPGPRQVRHTLDISQGRRARRGASHLTRLYAIEPALTLTGAAADHRLASARRNIRAISMALAKALGAPLPAWEIDAAASAIVQDMAASLKAASSTGLVTVGEAQPPDVHAIGHWINERLGAIGHTIELITPIEADPIDHRQSIAALAQDMAAGQVEALLMLEVSPVYDAPADLEFASALAKVPLSVRLGLYADETSEHATWHIPAAHALESWADRTAPNGTITLVQPLIAPLYGGSEPHVLLDALAGAPRRSGHDALRDYWQGRAKPADMNAWWRATLAKGSVDGTSAEVVAPRAAQLPSSLNAQTGSGFEATIMADAAVLDGTFSQNAWAQETPRPLSKLVWGNAAEISPTDAQKLGISDGDMVRLSLSSGSAIELPALIQPGTADGAVAIHLGYGRRTGVIGKHIGTDIAPLRRNTELWAAPVTVTPTGKRVPLRSTQASHLTAGRNLVRSMTLADFQGLVHSSDAHLPPSLYPANPRAYESPNQWAMVIDETACTGCNACVAACQAENNVPVVGPDEVARGRDMHWLRVDTYFQGDTASPSVVFQPVPCMHCEKAPCEPMCPVEASIHDSEGLNVQVYNRCVGTRFCQANCPYKVRRFNFFGYADGQEYGPLGAPVLQAAKNPDVSVRARGVMEKCTYCVQRIGRARRTAAKDDRPIRDGEVVTACQQACPARAITFGNSRDADAAVSHLRAEPHNYAMLEELGTRPRTTYLAQVRDRSNNGGRT